MGKEGFHVVTGAYGYSGQYIARGLLEAGREVRTLTNSLSRRNPFGDKVRAYPFNFGNRSALVESLRGAAVLYNTYWVRFNAPGFSHNEAVDNTKILFDSAKEAGVGRIVHVSITNPSEESKLEYFKGKAILERYLRESGLGHTILRPAVLFGKEDILVNNIAWMLRRLPVFGVFGSGNYRIQPIFVGDLARLAIDAGMDTGNRVIDAIGPETFTYRGMVKTIAKAIGKSRLLVPVPPLFGFMAASIMGRFLGDVMLTRDEVKGLMDGLLCTNSPPAGTTRLSEWAKTNADTLGVRYASEMARRRDRTKAYISQ